MLEPAALYLFALVPLLVVAYLARERPRRVIVSSVLAFRALHVMRGQRFGGRPRFNWTFFLELLILCLAVLAMARPFVVHQGNPVAAVLDNSAAMQAQTTADKTRFAEAVDKLRQALSSASSGQVTIFLTAPQVHQLGVYSSAGAAEKALAKLAPVDAPDDSAALTNLLNQLASDRHLGTVIFASYRPIGASVPARMRTITVGQPIANYAIANFAINRHSFGSATVDAHLAVANFSPAAQTLTVTLSAEGKIAGRASAHLAPGAVGALEFAQLAPVGVYRAELQPADGFMLDNRAWATASTMRKFSILFVSPTPRDGRGLGGIPGITVTTETPNSYSPNALANADLAIFEFTVPKQLPSINSLLVMPPPGDPVFDFKSRPSTDLSIAGWPTTDPLTDNVNFRLLNMRSGEYFDEHPWMRPIVNGDGGGLMLSGVRQGHRFVAVGFNPFPYLAKRNLPMSILTLNLLSYLAGFGSHAAGYRTGEPWLIPAGVGTVITPSGRQHKVTPASLFHATTAQGIYQLIGNRKSQRAVNLDDLTTSDLENVTPLRLQTAVTPTSSALNVRMPLEPYVIALILLLLLIEAVLVYRRRGLPELQS
ncbi:MAG: BatA domain-containing protein [Candidatus Binataceae bacterium]